MHSNSTFRQQHWLNARAVANSVVDLSDVADSEASFVSSVFAVDKQRCFLEGTMLPDAEGRLDRAEDAEKEFFQPSMSFVVLPQAVPRRC